MHPEAARAWGHLVTCAVTRSWTMAEFHHGLTRLGIEALLRPSFDPDERVPLDLEIRQSGDSKDDAITIEDSPRDQYHPQTLSCLSHLNMGTVLLFEQDLPSSTTTESLRPTVPGSEFAQTFMPLPTPPHSSPEVSPTTNNSAMPPAQAEITTATAPKTAIKAARATTIGPRPVKKRKATDCDTLVAPTPRKQKTKPQKSKCWSRPVVWSNRRQELCETVPYYKSYQASWHHPGGIAKAMLIAQDPSPRRYVDMNVIITRATGKMGEGADKNGPRVTVESHTDNDRTVRAVKDARAEKRAVIVIASNKLDLLPVDLPENYQVLDYFWITDFWWEKVDGHNVFKYRFERCDIDEKPWYAPDDVDYVNPDPTTFSLRWCEKCKQTSPQVYQVWTCLHHECSVFWKLPGGREVNEKTLVFNEAFINKRGTFTGTKEYNIQPPDFETVNEQMAYQILFDDGRLGLWCKECGKCCSREDWMSWKCTCGNERRMEMPLLTAPEADRELNKEGQIVPLKAKAVLSTIKALRRNIGNYKVEIYEVLQDQWIIHFKSNAKINAQLNGPDQLFKDMQEAKGMSLCRRVVGCNKKDAASAQLTSHFAQNYGLPYEFIVAQDSSPFATAPPAVCHALQLMIWAGGETKMDQHKPFNEMLVVGYNADNLMHYHDDGEETLGPTIATLSLGSSAEMHFRYKKKYWKVPLDDKAKKYTAEAIVFKGVPLEAERKAMQKWIASNPHSTPETQASHFKKMAKVKEYLARNRAISHTDVVKLMLEHGDLCIMHGADLQKYIEHQVEPRGCLRFALTSRHVLPHLLDPAVLHMGDVDLSAYPEYNGSAVGGKN